MAKAGRKPRQEKSHGADNLIAALKFVSAAQKRDGQQVFESHCVFYGGFVLAFDGVLTIGHPIAEEVNTCPNTFQFLAALQKCSDELSITQVDHSKLAVKSKKFNARIDCVSLDAMPYFGPDAPIAVLDDRVKHALSAVMPLANESASRTALQAIMLQAGTAVATNGAAILECQHMIDLPPNLLLPKVAAKAIVGSDKKLARFGWTPNQSATFYFEDGSYIKTQLYDEQYVNYKSVLDIETNPFPINDDFFKGLGAIEPFLNNSLVYMQEKVISSSRDLAAGATYEVDGLPQMAIFNADYLRLLEHAFQNVDFQPCEQGHRVFCFSRDGMMRGAVMGIRV